MTGSSLNSFTKVKSHLINLIGSFNKMSGFVDEGRAMDLYLDFSRAFHSDSNNAFIDKIIKRRPGQ